MRPVGGGPYVDPALGSRLHRRRRSSVTIRTFKQFLAEEFEEIAGRVEGLLPAEGLCVLLGAEKVGKSLLAILLVLCAAAGRPFLGRKTAPCAALIVEEEGSAATLQERIGNIANALGVLDSNLPLYVVHRTRWRLDDQRHILEIEAAIVEHSIRLIVMGPLAQLADIDDENKAAGFNLVTRNLLDLASRTHVLVVLIHHRRKSDPKRQKRLSIREFFESSRGANALTAAMDVGLGLDRDPEVEAGELLVLARDAAPQRFQVRLDFATLAFTEYQGQPTSREQADLDQLIELVREKGTITAEDATVALNVSLNTAKSRLRALVGDGRFSRQDTHGHASTWSLGIR